MAKFSVEKNVEVTAIRGAERLYPYDDMAAGDSFLIPFELKTSPTTGHLETGILFRARNKAATSFRSWIASDPMVRGRFKIVTRIQPAGLRVWLVNR